MSNDWTCRLREISEKVCNTSARNEERRPIARALNILIGEMEVAATIRSQRDGLVTRLRENAEGEGLAIFSEAADALAYLEAQDGLLSKAQDEVKRLRDELAEIKRPLDAQMARLNENLIAANEEIDRLRTAPIDMLLHCPACLHQHIDRDDGAGMLAMDVAQYGEPWRNPPHRSHLCGNCGFVWRPADVPTNGVAAIKTRGKNDMVMFDGPAVELERLRRERELQNPPKLEWDGDRP